MTNGLITTLITGFPLAEGFFDERYAEIYGP